MKLGLGTVQFGLPYGISNTRGQPDQTEIKKILNSALNAGVRVLDTAAAYGESEQRLGCCGAADPAPFRIVTKTAVQTPGRTGKEQAEAIQRTFTSSLAKLQRRSVYGLLAHHAEDLTGSGGGWVLESLRRLVAEKKVEKIGVSVYTGEEIDRILNVFTPDIVQVPVNVFDQRLLASGHLKSLKNIGVEVHARSVFLQGLLLMDPKRVPPFFFPVRGRLERYQEMARSAGLTPVQAALGFVTTQTEIDTFVVGVAAQAELEELLSAHASAQSRLDFSSLALSEEKFLNPSLWNLKP